MSDLAAIVRPDFLFRDALLACLLVGIVCPWVGVYFILRRIIFLGVALPQISSAGIALAFLLHNLGWHFLPHDLEERWMALAGSLSLTLLTILGLALLERRPGNSEGRIGAVFVVAGALGILFVAADPLGETRLLALLKGDILLISYETLVVVAIAYGALGLALAAFHRELLLVSYDPEIATTLGRRVALWQAVLFAIVGIAISIGVMTVGPMVVFGLLLLPPLAACRTVRGFLPLCAVSSLLGALSAFAGFYLSYRFDLPLGPTVVVTAAGWLVIGALGQALRRIASVAS
ncbi:MAG: metal ABC transporter permease [Deltaproteobacteria bacterium]|nr:metal ABC transporter permease [Deltaproteobacteria bacterium]